MAEFGIYEKALLTDDIEESLVYAKKEGYSFWELAVDNERKERLDWEDNHIEELLMICHRSKMPIYNMVLSLHRDYPLGSTNQATRDLALDYLYKAIDLASRLGIRTIQLAGYITSGDGVGDGSISNYIESLISGTAYASSKGILLGIENMDYDLIDAKTILEVVKAVSNPFLGMFLDVGNFAANNFDPIKELEDCFPYLFGIHLKETQKGVYRRVKYGEGIVEFKQIFQFLKENNYDGYYGVEMWNDNSPESLEEIKSAINWLKGQG